MGALIAFLGSAFAGFLGSAAKLFTIETLKFVAWRALLMFTLFVALPIILYNIFTDLVFDFIEYAMTFLSNQGLSATTIEISGLAAWMAQELYLVEAFSVYMSFVAIRFLTRFIPIMK